MQKDAKRLKDDFVEYNKKLTRLHYCVKIAELSRESTKDELIQMDKTDCPECRGNGENDPCQEKPHIQDLCPADREKIAQLVKKLAECTQTRHEAEADLAEIRSENESLINRYELYCNEHENETSILKQQLEIAASREKTMKLESTRSLNALGDQLDAQEREFVKLTETVRDLLREKIQLQNALIERESRVRIAESKLERSKETLEMEKLLFIKEHARDSILRKKRDRCTQTCETIVKKDVIESGEKIKISSRIKSKDDLEETSSDGILLRSLFFKSSRPYENEHFSGLDVLNRPAK